MVSQDAELLLTERRRDPFTAVVGEHLDLLVVEQCLVEHERTRFLAERTERCHVGRPWRPELGVGVRCADGVGTGRQDRCVDVVAGGVHRSGRLALGVGHPPVGSDEDELVDGGAVEWDTPVEQPEVIRQDRVAGRDVPIAELPPAHRAEDPIAERTHPLAVRSLCLGRAHGVERLDPRKRRIGRLAHPPERKPRAQTTFALHFGWNGSPEVQRKRGVGAGQAGKPRRGTTMTAPSSGSTSTVTHTWNTSPRRSAVNTSAAAPLATADPVVQQDQPVGVGPGECQVVHRRHDRQPAVFAQFGDELERLLLMADVERRGRLVEQQHGRLLRECSRQHGALAFAAAHRTEHATDEPAEPQPLDDVDRRRRDRGPTRCRSSRRTGSGRAARSRTRTCRRGSTDPAPRRPPAGRGRHR